MILIKPFALCALRVPVLLSFCLFFILHICPQITHTVNSVPQYLLRPHHYILRHHDLLHRNPFCPNAWAEWSYGLSLLIGSGVCKPEVYRSKFFKNYFSTISEFCPDDGNPGVDRPKRVADVLTKVCVTSQAIVDKFLDFVDHVGQGNGFSDVLSFHSDLLKRCIYVSEAFNWNSPTCPHSFSCGEPVLQKIDQGWFQSTYVCTGREFSDSGMMMVAKMGDFFPVVAESLTLLRGYVLRDAGGKIAFLPPECKNDFVTDIDHPYWTSESQKVCTEILRDSSTVFCPRKFLYDPSAVLYFLLHLPVYEYPFFLPSNNDYSSFRLIYPGLASNCSLDQAVDDSDCRFLRTNLFFNFTFSKFCTVVHRNKHNWFTSLILGILHAILDPLLELLLDLLQYLIDLLHTVLEFLVKDIKVLFAFSYVLFLRFKLECWSLALPVAVFSYLLYIFINQ
nr:TPA_asm: hypothetical protein [Clonorsi virus 1]